MKKEEVEEILDYFLEYQGEPKEFIASLFKNNFELEITNSNNKRDFIESELKSLAGILKQFELLNHKLILLSYLSNYYSSFELDESIKDYSLKEQLQIDLGKAMADYHTYLDQAKNSLPTVNVKEHQYSTQEQLLLLEYFGMLQTIRKNNSDIGISDFLGGLLNRNPQEVRAAMGKLSSIKAPSSKNDKVKFKGQLSSLQKDLDRLKLPRVSKKIKMDIERIGL